MKNRKRLNRIVLVKHRQHDVRRAAQATAAMELRRAEDNARSLEQEVTRLSHQMTAIGTIVASELQLRAAIIERTRIAIVRAIDAVSSRRDEHTQRAQETSETAREIVALERVEDRLRKERDRKLKRLEQAQLDEAAHRGAAG